MKITRLFAVVSLTLVFAFAVYADGAHDMHGMKMKGSDMKKTDDKGMCAKMDMSNCPFCVKGAEVKVVNTVDGIQITVVSKDKAAAKEIQKKGAIFAETCAKTGGKDEAAAVKSAVVTETTMDGSPDDIVICPVTGDKLKKKDAFAVYEYKGKKYYMCCGMCPKPFTTNPEKYVK